MEKTDFSSVSSKLIIFLLLAILCSSSAFAQVKKNKYYEAYIDKYSDMAVRQMQKHKIPASITLAQGLLESGAGVSDLAKSGNNHFGIKCHKDWKGKSMRKDDDFKNECFRVYNSPEESFEDHSLFIRRDRYKGLFALDITDYRGWASGLQRYGYATDKAYANKLIKIIEDYELYQYDKGGKRHTSKQQNLLTEKPKYRHTPYKTHNLVYIIAAEGDTYEDIANEFDFKAKDLCKYNEVPEDFPLKKGDLVYFEKKKSKANKPYYEHVVQVGESMHSISQLYGIKVKNLYKMNKKDFEYVPEEGDVLKLR